MTQLELPPISFARYLELLKRRRWQVLPMSVVGLLVGAVVAFLIPRYYVASTVLTYTGSVLDKRARTDSDPLYVMARNAPVSVMAAIPDALEKLELIGTSLVDPARQQIIDRTVGRTKVVGSQVEKGRTDYRITIEYRDPDGPKSALFANTLREVWTSSLITEFEEKSAVDMREAAAEVTARQRAADDVRTEIRRHRELHGIEPGEEELGRQGVMSLRKNELREREAKVTDLKGEIVGLTTEIDQLQAAIDDGFVQRTRIVERPIGSDPQFAAQVATLVQGMRYHEDAMGGFNEGTAPHEHHRSNYEVYRRRLQELVPQGLESGVMRVEEENPLYRDTVQSLNEDKAHRSNLSAQLKVHQDFADSLRERIAELPGIWEEYERQLSKRTELTASLLSAREVADGLDAVFRRARTQNPFKKIHAIVPPAPTDPDVTVVAIMGSVLGLAAAIGLILLLDFLRSTFKTVDDVNYGLTLPVLGVMSFLETDEVRIKTVRQRRRISVVVAIFVILVLSILTVYYIAPTRLPLPVLDALDAILGGESGR